MRGKFLSKYVMQALKGSGHGTTREEKEEQTG